MMKDENTKDRDTLELLGKRIHSQRLSCSDQIQIHPTIGDQRLQI